MTIIVFLVDTSASMNQKIFLGGRPTLLDVAKSAVEYFVKVRQRTPESRGDRYMLLTYEEAPNNIRAGWKENLSTFMSELKNLEATGLTTFGNALRQTFDVLNVNRMQHGIDTYGQGRCPFYLEPSIVVVITDGGLLCSNSGVSDEIKLHGTSPGTELTREPFRWDQRLFALVLKMSGQPSSSTNETGLVPTDDSPIELMCDATGGRSYAITTHRMLHQCIESIAQKVVAGVVLHFEKWGPDPPLHDGEEEDTKWHSNRRMIHVPRPASGKSGYGGGFWPIPESFWPDPASPSLPARSAHPHVRFTCVPHEPMILENFPFDKYDLEPNPLTKFILARKLTGVWQVFLPNSSKTGGLGHSFGYLKASANFTSVNLFVMPYNYPVLLPLLQDLLHIHRLKPTNEWRAQFYAYQTTIPPYYLGPLKRALQRVGAGAIAQTVGEENYLSGSVLTYLKQLKFSAKLEYERTCAEVGARVVAKEAASASAAASSGSYKNPFDIPRGDLLDALTKLRTQFFHPNSYIDTRQALHNQPIQQMGNYVEYLKRVSSPLRELESTTPVRQHMFGNPFKIDKRIVVDQIDEAEMEPTAGPSDSTEVMPHLKPKRKPGPLPANYHFKPMRDRTGEETPWSGPEDDPDMDMDTDHESNLSPAPAPFTPQLADELETDFKLENGFHEAEVEDEEMIDLEPPSVIPEPEPEPEPEIEEVKVEPVIVESSEDEESEPEAAAPENVVVPEEPVLDEATVWSTNITLRDHIFREIRRPLVRMDLLQTHLHSLVGSGETKRKMVKMLEQEALRFKRRRLAKVFEEHSELLLKTST